jgi:hypothetical protein
MVFINFLPQYDKLSYMNTYKCWQQSLLSSIQLQLFISFISLPFLIAWGLPVSLLSPVSTLIFGPFLTCFLLISSLIFFLELLYLPNGILIWCLERVTSTWLACLSFEQRAWLIGFTKPPIIIIMLIPVIALAIIHSKKITCTLKRIFLLGLFLTLTCTALKFFPYRHDIIQKIPCNKGEITLINHNNAVIVIDPGYLASRPSYESYISYSLLPEIIQRTGKLHIDHLIVFKFNKRILDALQFLATKLTIRDLYIPAWRGRIPGFAWRSYVKLKRTIAENNGRIFSISYKKRLHLGKNDELCIEPVATKDVSYYDATYKPLEANGLINGYTINL